MSRSVPDWLRLNKAIAVQCVVVFTLAIGVTTLIARWKDKILSPAEGFDFNARKTGPSSGPMVGDVVDMRALKGKDGRTLAEVTCGTPFSMIAVVDPHCPACKAAENQISGISNQINNAGIPYSLSC